MKTTTCISALVAVILATVGFAQAPATPMDAAPKSTTTQPAATPPKEPELRWHRVETWGVEGRMWQDQPRTRYFDRFPASAENKIPAKVWRLGHESAGMLVRFKTDATTIWASYTLFLSKIAPYNMTAMGASGMDLYARDDAGQWRWVGALRPETQDMRQDFISGLAPVMREYMAYLPLYNGLDDLRIGVPPEAHFEPLAPRSDKPIVFYGTSITHGSGASRPGMTHTAILGRRLNVPIVNLGFSGSGKMDASVGEYIAQIDAAVFVIDCLPNMGPEEIRQKCPPLVKMLRAAHPKTPIVLVEDRRNTNAWVLPKRNQLHTDNHAALKECYEAFLKEGITGLYYLGGDDLMGRDSEASVDGSHPSDLGYMRYADAFEPVLRAALGLK